MVAIVQPKGFSVFTEGPFPTDHAGLSEGTYSAWLGRPSGPPMIAHVTEQELEEWIGLIAQHCRHSPDLFVTHEQTGGRLAVVHAR